MMTVALSLAIVVLICALVYERRESRAERRELIASFNAERQVLLNRIQAPETAVAQTIAATPGKKHVPFDDDDAYARMTSGDTEGR